MLIITQNLHHWWWNRFEWLINKLLDKDPDVLILTERRNNKLELLDSLKRNYHHYCIQWIKPIKNSVSILTKKQAILDWRFQNNVLTIIYQWLKISWVYFPQKNEKEIVFNYLLNSDIQNNHIIAWDFNTWKYFTDEQWKTFYCTKEFIDLSESKMTDARKTRHSDTIDYSRYSNAGNGFRIDHIIVSKSLNDSIVKCEYDHTFRWKWLSDHSMMFVKLNQN
jgi:exonuclease III